MKKIFLIWFVCLAPVLATARGIDFVKGSWEEIKLLAAKEQKGIFVDVYTSWCAPCRKMSATVFTDEKVSEYINTHYIAVQLDAEKEKDHAFFGKYTPTAYPSFYWLNSKGELLDTKTGYMPADSFLAATENAEKSTLTAEWETCRRLWESGNRQSDFVRKYLFDILPQINPAEIRPLLNEYLAGLTEEQKANVETGRMVTHFSRVIEDDEVFRTLVRYNDIYQRDMGFAETGKQMYMTLVRVPMIDRRDTARFATDMYLLHTLEFPSKDMYLQLIDMETQLFDGNYKEGLSRALSVTESYGKEYTYLYAEICYTLIISRFFAQEQKPGTAEETDIAMQLARQAFELTPSKCTLTYLAAVHALKGDYKRAYELMMHAPFYDGPALSNAVYALLQLPSKREL